MKRKIIFGTYDTAEHGWTLSSLTLGDAEQKTNYIEKTGGDGAWDMSTAMTEGVPRYKNRELIAVLECSNGTRAEREALISELVNQLDGWEWRIVLPDHPERYLIGRAHVKVNYSNLAHAAVTITCNCEPWLYFAEDTIVTLTAASTAHTAIIKNTGRRSVVPEIEVAGSGSVRLVYNGASTELSAGTYEWPSLLLTPGEHTVQYRGEGTITITYREAVLR